MLSDSRCLVVVAVRLDIVIIDYRLSKISILDCPLSIVDCLGLDMDIVAFFVLPLATCRGSAVRVDCRLSTVDLPKFRLAKVSTVW